MSEQNAGNGELLGCPFCGGSPVRFNENDGAYHGVRGAKCDIGITNPYVEEDFATKAWNTRAPSVGAGDDIKPKLINLLWEEFCPAIRITPEDYEHYGKIAERIIALSPSSAHPAQGLVKAVNCIMPYLRWQLSKESPGYHPTFPSAVAQLEAALSAQGKDTGPPKRLPDGCCGYTDADGECCTPTPSREG